MSRFCLDTSAYSHFQRSDSQVVELIDAADWIGLPAIVLGELRIGFSLGRARERNEGTLHEFLLNPSVDVLDIDEEASVHYADIVIDLRRLGTPIPTNDIWIAAAAAASGSIILTYDDHFAQVSRIGTTILSED